MKDNPFYSAIFSLLLGLLAIACLSHHEDKSIAKTTQRHLYNAQLDQEIQILKLETQIINLEADKQNLLSVILTQQIAEDRRGFDYPNPLLPPLPR